MMPNSQIFLYICIREYYFFANKNSYPPQQTQVFFLDIPDVIVITLYFFASAKNV